MVMGWIQNLALGGGETEEVAVVDKQVRIGRSFLEVKRLPGSGIRKWNDSNLEMNGITKPHRCYLCQ